MHTLTLKASLVLLGFCCIPLGRGCEISNEAKKNLKEKVTVMERSAGSVEGKCRDCDGHREEKTSYMLCIGINVY